MKQTATTIDKNSGVAVWRQIKDLLGDKIKEGTFGPGDRLPTEQDFAQTFGVNRHTVRRAIGALVEDGLLRVEQGRGTFVQESIILYPVSKRTRFSANIAAQKKAPGGTLLDSWVEQADAATAAALNIRKGTRVIVLWTLGVADSRPVSLIKHCFPHARFAKLTSAFQSSGSVSVALRECGVPDYIRKSSRITTRMPTAREAELLKQPLNRPILVSENINHDLNGLPIEYAESLFSGDRVQVVFEP